MPSEDNEPEMSEMRSDLDSVQSDFAVGLSEMQEPSVAVPQEEAKYRVRLYPYGGDGEDWYYLEYFADYGSAYAVYSDICDDRQFIKAYKSRVLNLDFVRIEIQKQYRTFTSVIWETVLGSSLYDPDDSV